MIKKWTALLAVAALTATTACGTDSEGNQVDQGSSPDTTKQLEPAELTFYSTTNNFKVESFDERYGNKIREKFPNYKINYIVQEDAQTLPNLIATGQSIDVLLSSIGHTSAYLINLNMQHDIAI